MALKPISLFDDRGVSTVEFALVLPAFLMMLIGGMHLSLLGFTAASLHYAAQDGARCGAIQTTRCTTGPVAQTHALGKFRNITGSTATFTATTTGASCGYRMVGTVTYTLKTGLASFDIPLSAMACYPT